MSSTTIKLDNELLAQAKIYGEVNKKRVLEQFVYWAKIGKTA